MRNPELYLFLAGSYAKTEREEPKAYRFGGIGVRADGAIVKSRNGSGLGPVPEHHCEARLCRKLTPGSTVYVARVSRAGDTGFESVSAFLPLLDPEPLAYGVFCLTTAQTARPQSVIKTLERFR